MNASINPEEWRRATLQRELGHKIELWNEIRKQQDCLELTRGQMGVNTPPWVVTQMDKNEEELTKLRQEINKLEDELGGSSKAATSGPSLPPVTTERHDISQQDGLPSVDSPSTKKDPRAAGGSQTVDDLIRQKSDTDEAKKAIQPIEGYIDKFQQAIESLRCCAIIERSIGQLRNIVDKVDSSDRDTLRVLFASSNREILSLFEEPCIKRLQEWAESIQPPLDLIDEKVLADYRKRLQRARNYVKKLKEPDALPEKPEDCEEIYQILLKLRSEVTLMTEAWKTPQSQLHTEIMHRIKKANELLALHTGSR